MGVFVDKKNISLDLDMSLPVSIELTKGSIHLLRGEEASCIIEYSKMGDILPEINIKKDNKNHITIGKAEVLDAKFIFFFPDDIKGIETHLSSGDILIQDINGILDLQADNGDIQIKKCKGKIKAAAFSGNVKINEFTGGVDINTANGSARIIDWSDAGGSIQTNNGEVVIGVNNFKEEMSVNNLRGKICIGLADSCSCTIIARGTDVVKYIEDIYRGDHLGSPAKVDWKDGGIKIQLFSQMDKVFITTIEKLKDVSPDLEDIFKEFEKTFRESFNFEKIAENFKGFGKKMQDFGNIITENVKKAFNDIEKKSDDKKDKTVQSEKMEILNMLKEGKITAEEAERLLKALK